MTQLLRLTPKPVREPHQKRAVRLLQTRHRWPDADVVFLRTAVCAPCLSAAEQARLDMLAKSMEAEHG